MKPALDVLGELGHLEIEQGVPLPETRGGAQARRYPFGVMEIGESVFVPGYKLKPCWDLLRYYKPRRFKVRTLMKDAKSGVRVWRIA